MILLNGSAFASEIDDFGSSKFDKLVLLKSSEWLEQNKRALNIIPEKRKVSKKSFNPSTTFTAYDYSIAIPLSQNIQYLRNDNISAVYSVNTFAVSIENPKKGNWTTIFRKMKNNGKIGWFPDKDTLDDEYKLVNTALNKTYDELINETYLDTVAQIHFFLSIKNLYVGRKSDRNDDLLPIYTFETNSLKGYQVGNLERTHIIDLYIFGHDNKLLKMKIVTDPENNKYKMTQDHIDFILNSIKKVENKGA
jgi:hypothetical protein